ncbi:endoribonuclease dcr-1 [Mytilinidion resinicola]|uniref:Dicer-like protein 1 n=1 Tax=Mytilinidion resinicola TaxID=574789 RepID=A0A6A6Y2Q0_9PEZI|nr:endoribonuclease dcr-1 [Mytilinidion resinicola]KAF2803072.1 endoribonuclease dcr-1 [Mytilinidion resinicola]
MELFEKAKQENIIAVLDTGSGKTHIATLLLRYIIDEELESRAKENPPRLAFFLVDSVNLVFQQTNVLQCGLDHNVVGLCGSMGVDLWEAKTWQKHFASNMVIVCTAEVLVQCLMHSFISMARINLLIFDEAHHAKKNHAYARILKDYYMAETVLSKRPKVFGMTASPVDAKVDVKQAAIELENLLHCKIATTSDLTLMQNQISKPFEDVVYYEALPAPFETQLHQQLRACFGDLRPFQKLFRVSKEISSELGKWAADIYWSFAFSEEEERKTEMRQERRFHAQKVARSMAKLDAEVALLRQAAEVVKNFDFGIPKDDLNDISSKVKSLIEWLRQYFSRDTEARCIVFVERRYTARLLLLITKHLGGSYLRGGILVGVNSNAENVNVSLRQQVLTVASFRKGELNCLFATSVAEEGLDIPQCNLVVRFDLYRTMISYVQSRGRARHKNSKYLHMVEKGNLSQSQTVYEARGAERIMRSFCQQLPADRLIDVLDADAENEIAKQRSLRSFTDPKTGAKLTYGSSLGVLAHFCACLPQGEEAVSQPAYIIARQGGKFICEVILPDASPIRSALGVAASKKAIAKQGAAFEACIALWKGRYINGHLLPIYTKQLPAMRNAQLALDAKKKDLYLMRTKPEFWNYGRGERPKTLYMTILDLDNGLERPHTPICLLTRQKFPSMPVFPLYLANGTQTGVTSVSLDKSFEVSEEQLEQLTLVTLRVYHDIFAKIFENDASKMTYWLAPLKPISSLLDSSHGHPLDLINWEDVNMIFHYNNDARWTPEVPNESLANRFIVDLWDGGRRFFSIAVDPSKKPLDPVPSTAPRNKRFNDNILDYSVSLWSKSRTIRKWDLSQPVVAVEKVPFRRNLLAPIETDDEIVSQCSAYVCPEPLRFSSLPANFVATCYTFPAIIHRFDSYLIALDACKVSGLEVGPALALEALTKDSDNTEDHEGEKINIRSGMGPNYERLEFMGDCFLKMATSISVFVQRPDDNEFEFHVRRMLLLCNKNLFKTARKLQLYEYVRSMAFSRRLWYPEGLKLLHGKGSKKTGDDVIRVRLGDKSVADICEALIGAAFMEHNELGTFEPARWDQAVKAVKVMVDNDDHKMEKWADYYKAYSMPKYQYVEATASQLDLAAQVEEKHPYHFKWPRLLRSAFVHPSQTYMWEKIPHYQRLEFLGDSLLDMVFVAHLFYRYPTKDPQWLTEHKMPMVSNKFLGALCVKLDFHVHLRHNNQALQHQIREYVTEVKEAECEAKGSPDYWTTVSEPPKCLADIIEAFVGALFVDSEFDFNTVQQFFDLHVKSYFEDMSIYDTFANNHPTTKLTKLLQVGLGCQDWRIATRMCDSVIPGARPTVVAMVLVHMKVIADGTAVSGRYARIKASNNGLDLLEGLPQFEFRQRFGCDCQEVEEGSKEVGKTEEELQAEAEKIGCAI